MPNYTPIYSAESFKPDRVQMQKLREKLATSMAVRQCLIHTYESITPFGLQRFFIPTIKKLQQYYNSKPFNPTLTSLEEEAYALIYIKNRRSSPGGHKSQGDRPLQLRESQSMLIWSRTEPTCQSWGWLSWHINPQTDTSIHRASKRAHTCGGEREGAIPHKGSLKMNSGFIQITSFS